MRRCNCLRHAVGAVIAVEGLMVSAGYNGTARGHANCVDGGCERCAKDTETGSNYDTCVCVHAEQNAYMAAAKHGVSVKGGTLYTTRRPCFSCLKEAIQVGISRLAYVEGWQPPKAEERGVYRRYEAETQDFMKIEPLVNGEVVEQVKRRVQEHDEDVIDHLLEKGTDRTTGTVRERAAEYLPRARAGATPQDRAKHYAGLARLLKRGEPGRSRARTRALDVFLALAPQKWPDLNRSLRPRASARRSSRRADSAPHRPRRSRQSPRSAKQ